MDTRLGHLDVVGFEDRVITYKVLGKTIHQIKRNMAQRTIAPDGYCGYTLYHYTIFHNRRNGLLLYQIVTILPQWNRKGSKKVVKEWSRFFKAQSAHEQNHRKIFSAAYEKIRSLVNPIA